MKIIVIVSAFVTFEMSGIQHSAHRHLAPRSYSSLKGSKPEYLHTTHKKMFVHIFDLIHRTHLNGNK